MFFKGPDPMRLVPVAFGRVRRETQTQLPQWRKAGGPATSQRKESPDMRKTLFICAMAALLAAVNGCCGPRYGTCQSNPETCRNCDPDGIHGRQAADPGIGGVAAYPYYTTRGPRDFLDRNPQSIGP